MQIGPHGRVRRAVAMVTAVTLSVSPVSPLLAGAGPGAGFEPGRRPSGAQAHGRAPEGGAGAAPSAAAPTPHDGGWPRAYATPSGGKIIVYQPQVASWDEQKHMVAYAAVSYEPKGATKPALGSVKIEADTKVVGVRAPRQLQGLADHGVQLPHPPQGADARGGGGDRQGDPRRRARHRARPRAGQRGPQPDHPEGGAGREGGPARRSSSARRRPCS